MHESEDAEMNNTIKFRKRAALSEPKVQEIYLDHCCSSANFRTKLVTDFVKFLCYQKGQIPVTANQLEGQTNLVQNDLNSYMPDIKLTVSLFHICLLGLQI